MIIKKITAILLLFASISYAQQIGNGRALEIPDFSAPLASGVYQGSLPNGMNPDQSFGWQHLFVIRHSNDTNNYQLQLSSSYTMNDRLFFRKIAGSLEPNNLTWIELATRGTNNFVGNQNIDGNLGIGSISPNAPLDIVTNQSAQGIIIRKRASNDFGNISFYDNSGSTGLAGIGVGPNRIRIMSGGLGDAFEKFSMTSSGLVGINSIAPLNTFEVKVPTSTGSSSSDGISIHDGAIYRLGINIGVNTQYEYSYLQAVKGGIGQKNIIINPIGGNVGIGITNPSNKLDVKGTIHSQEVKVDMLDWSDFVFKKEYSLPTLEEVEKHIIEKGHLENIPSEEEVVKNGINLGEMNSKLLQKIEELTLYVIEQNKKTEQLENFISNQNRVISEQNKRLEKLENKQ
ncbi:hypothetical protein [Flavobacterium sharifuzzamanii]|uniref:hypothetical protein n=1 Tax=Flavobacterium sharifuzzamanii TaxID=2211133 RepID=UPI000DAF3150|nr:hypothetical protein [Flavobacterium sharifuzzamanii]KAF2080630.1 hypothetical protein DMA14_10645 [Flavobacterium sharifuzzamanii]